MSHPAPSSAAPAGRITLRLGQAVAWPKAFEGIAQVAELRRTRVRLVYLTKHRRTRHRTLSVAELAAIQARQPLLFDLPDNPFNRGVIPKTKTYPLPAPGRDQPKE